MSFTELAFRSASGYCSPRWEFESINKYFRKEKKPNNPRQFKSRDKLNFQKVCTWAAVKVTIIEHIAAEMNCHSKKPQKVALFFSLSVLLDFHICSRKCICVTRNTEILKTWKFSFEITFEIWSDPCIVA